MRPPAQLGAADQWKVGAMPAAVAGTDHRPAAVAPYARSLGGSFTAETASFTISTRLQGRSVLLDTDLTRDEIAEVLETAIRLKGLWRAKQPQLFLAGKTLGMLFQHPSTQTRVAF